MPELQAHHYGLTVDDLDRAVAFYRDVLDLAVVDRFSVGGEAFATAVDVPGASADFVHLDAGSARLELVSYDPAGAARSAGSVDTPGATHLAFAAEDVDAVYRSLSDDVTTLSAPRTTASGTRILFLRDPEGNLIEVLEA